MKNVVNQPVSGSCAETKSVCDLPHGNTRRKDQGAPTQRMLQMGEHVQSQDDAAVSARLLLPVFKQLMSLARAQANKEPAFKMPEAIERWRQARAESNRLAQAYNEATAKARDLDEIKGFGYSCVDDEFQAMCAASRRAYALMPAALDALYELQIPHMEVIGAQSRFIGDVWQSCSVEHHQMVLATPADWPGYETRLVYALASEDKDAKPQG